MNIQKMITMVVMMGANLCAMAENEARIRPITDMQQAHRCLSGNRESDGFNFLAQKGRLDLSLEALAVKKQYTALFTDEEANNALMRLLDAGYKF